MKVVIESGDKIGYLETQWSWNSKNDVVWKCTCECGLHCYANEKALINGIVKDCGCGTYRIDRLKIKKMIKNILQLNHMLD